VKPTVVTGASGFVGRRLVRKLLERGAAVRVLCRHPQSLSREHGDRIEVIPGSILDRAALACGLREAGTVHHLAACARAWVRDPQEYQQVNVEGTRRLLEAAAVAGVERVVHVSTVLTLPEVTRPWLVERRRAPTEYERTKLAAEQVVHEYLTGGGDAVVVHPARIYGPGPLSDANAVTKMIGLYLRGLFRLRLADGDVLANYVHVDDVADGILLAAERGRTGGHYVLGGEHASIRGLLSLVAELSGIRRQVFSVRVPMAMAAAYLMQACGHLTGHVPITADWVRAYLDDQRVETEGTARALRYAPRPLRQGIAETLQWLAGSRPATGAK